MLRFDLLNPADVESLVFSFGKPSKKKFAKQLIQAMQSVTPGTVWQYDAVNFCLLPVGEEGIVNLSNLYTEHCSLDKRERADHVQRLASVFANRSQELPEDFAEAQTHLRPKIWNRSTFDLYSADKAEQWDLPLYPLGSHLYSSLVFDTADAMRSISNEDLEKWGVSYYEAMEIAYENLGQTTLAWASIGSHFFTSTTGDSYDSSRVLLVDRIREMDLIGEPIAIVPTRDELFIAGSEDPQSLEIMLTLTEKTMEEGARPLCPLPLILQNGVWNDWVMPDDHPLRERVEQLELPFLGSLYSDQQQRYNEAHEGREDVPFCATFSGMEDKATGKVGSFCVWSPIEILLPRTQHIVFTEGDGIVASGSWERVSEIVGDLLEEDTSFYPTRFRAREFPSEAQLSAIGNEEPM